MRKKRRFMLNVVDVVVDVDVVDVVVVKCCCCCCC